MTPEARLRFHQLHSGPVLDKLQVWLTAQFAEKKVEPNSGLGMAIGVCSSTGSSSRCFCGSRERRCSAEESSSSEEPGSGIEARRQLERDGWRCQHCGSISGPRSITFSAGAAKAKILKRISSASARCATEPCMRD